MVIEVYNRTLSFFKTYFSILFPHTFRLTECLNGHIATGFLTENVHAKGTVKKNLLVTSEIAAAQCIRLPNVTPDNCRII
jgi:hypothetical protein